MVLFRQGLERDIVFGGPDIDSRDVGYVNIGRLLVSSVVLEVDLRQLKYKGMDVIREERF